MFFIKRRILTVLKSHRDQVLSCRKELEKLSRCICYLEEKVKKLTQLVEGSNKCQHDFVVERTPLPGTGTHLSVIYCKKCGYTKGI